MTSIVRLFSSEEVARQAVARLVDAAIPRETITVLTPYAGRPAEAVDAAIQSSVMPSSHRAVAERALTSGRAIVCVTPAYNTGQPITDILDGSGPVDTDQLPEHIPHVPAPFSEFLGMPVLTEGRSHLKLASSNFSLSSMFGLGLLSRRATPLSSMFGLKVLTSSKGSIAAGSSVQRMSGKPAPFSSMLGMKLLSSKTGSRAAGSSVQRMSGSAAPFSGFLGLRVLSRRK